MRSRGPNTHLVFMCAQCPVFWTSIEIINIDIGIVLSRLAIKTLRVYELPILPHAVLQIGEAAGSRKAASTAASAAAR